MKTIVMTLSLMMVCIGISQLSIHYEERQATVLLEGAKNSADKTYQHQQYKQIFIDSLESFTFSVKETANAMTSMVFSLVDYVLSVVSKMLASLIFDR